MARSISEIKKTMTDAFMADSDLKELYGLQSDATWAESFSTVSVENILIYIVAACAHMVEVLMEQYSADVDEKAERMVVASVPWYWEKALAFQLGDELTLDSSTGAYGYAKTDESKQVVKYAAVRDKGRSVQIVVSGDKNGRPTPLDDATMTAFRHYMNRVKVAGVMLNISTHESDTVRIAATVTIDPLVLDEQGNVLSGSGRPVETAIEGYLKGIAYGGTLNKTQLTQAILAANGVEDVELTAVEYTTDGGVTWTMLTGNNYTGVSGSYTVENLEGGLTYVV
jgi:hypothetical protein